MIEKKYNYFDMGNMGKFHISHVKFIWEAVLEKFLHIEKWINKNFSGAVALTIDKS